MRAIALCLFLLPLFCLKAHAQDSLATPFQPQNDSAAVRPQHMAFLDSVAMATEKRQQFIGDSLAKEYIMPDPNRPNAFSGYINNHVLYHGNFTFLDLPYKPKNHLGEGKARTSRDPWIIAMIIGLLLYTSFLNISMGAEIRGIFQSFYSKRSSHLEKDERRINIWAFIALFILFGATFALFLYQLAAYNNVYYPISGMQLFIALVAIILILFALKFIILKLIGFLFDIDKVVGDYITTLYLTYFNIAFVFLPVVICFSLIAAPYIHYLLAIVLFMVVVIFIWIYLRSSVNIISNFRFHKFYLFIYLCALEICPILILIKVLNL